MGPLDLLIYWISEVKVSHRILFWVVVGNVFARDNRLKSTWHSYRWLSMGINTTIGNITVSKSHFSLLFGTTRQILLIVFILQLLIFRKIHFYLWLLVCLFIKISVAKITVFEIWWHKDLWLNFLNYILHVDALLLLLILELYRVDSLNIFSTKRHWRMKLQWLFIRSTMWRAQMVILLTIWHHGLIGNCAITFVTILINTYLILLWAFTLLFLIILVSFIKTTLTTL